MQPDNHELWLLLCQHCWPWHYPNIYESMRDAWKMTCHLCDIQAMDKFESVSCCLISRPSILEHQGWMMGGPASLADRPTFTARQARGGQHYNRLPTRHCRFCVVLLLLMAVIPYHLGCQKPMKTTLMGYNLFVQFQRWVVSRCFEHFDAWLVWPYGVLPPLRDTGTWSSFCWPEGQIRTRRMRREQLKRKWKGPSLPRLCCFLSFFLGVSFQPGLSEPKQLQNLFYVQFKSMQGWFLENIWRSHEIPEVLEWLCGCTWPHQCDFLHPSESGPPGNTIAFRRAEWLWRHGGGTAMWTKPLEREAWESLFWSHVFCCRCFWASLFVHTVVVMARALQVLLSYGADPFMRQSDVAWQRFRCPWRLQNPSSHSKNDTLSEYSCVLGLWSAELDFVFYPCCICVTLSLSFSGG